jgi:hypothetical protein
VRPKKLSAHEAGPGGTRLIKLKIGNANAVAAYAEVFGGYKFAYEVRQAPRGGVLNLAVVERGLVSKDRAALHN